MTIAERCTAILSIVIPGLIVETTEIRSRDTLAKIIAKVIPDPTEANIKWGLDQKYMGPVRITDALNKVMEYHIKLYQDGYKSFSSAANSWRNNPREDASQYVEDYDGKAEKYEISLLFFEGLYCLLNEDDGFPNTNTNGLDAFAEAYELSKQANFWDKSTALYHSGELLQLKEWLIA